MNLLSALFSAIVAAALGPAPSSAQQWLYFAGENAVDGCGMACVRGGDPRWSCLGTVATLAACEALCAADAAACAVMTFSAGTGNCWARTDGVWQPAPADSGVTAGCDAARVQGCAPPPPFNSTNVSVAVGAPVGVPLHPLAPAVALDFWLEGA